MEEFQPLVNAEAGYLQGNSGLLAHQASRFALKWASVAFVIALVSMPFLMIAHRSQAGGELSNTWPWMGSSEELWAVHPSPVTCKAEIYFNRTQQEAMNIPQFFNALFNSRFNVFKGKDGHAPTDVDPAMQAIKSGIIPVGWDALAKSKGIKSVGVIGAGPSGLVSAKLLKQAGFEVVMIESETKVGGKANTYYSEDGKAHDLATKWIPTLSVGGIGTPSLQNSIIDDLKKVGLVVERSGGFQYVETLSGKVVEVPPIAQQCTRLKLASDLVRAVNIFEHIALCPGVHGVVKCGVASGSESLADWIQRKNLRCAGFLLAQYVDGLGGGPALEQHAGYALKSRSYFLLVAFVQQLVRAGMFDAAPSLLMPAEGPFLTRVRANKTLQKEIAKLPGSEIFQQGYDGFWKLFVQAYGLDVKLGEKVTKVVPGSMVQVQTTKSQYVFDHLIVAVPPLQSSSFLPSDYAAFWRRVKVSRSEVVAWKSSSTGVFSNPAIREPNVILFPESCKANLGRSGGLNYSGRFYGLANEHDDGIYSAIGLPRREDWVDGADASIQAEQMKALGFNLENGGNYLKRSYREWPSYVNGEDFGAWYADVQNLQGRNAISFVGEELAGNNVPAIIEHTTALFISGEWLSKRN